MKMAEKDRVIYRLAVVYRAYDDANPDVGMGWDDDHFIDMALADMKWQRSDVNYNFIMKWMKNK